jgi:uncharacterized cupredoxin-like copper-binding protein
VRAALGLVVVAATISACGSSGPHRSSSTAATAGAPVIAVKLTDAGCEPSDFSLHPGTTVFSVTNAGTTKVKEMEITDQRGNVRGDVEGVGPGRSGSFVIDLKPGVYRVRCPEDSRKIGTLTVG